MIKNICIAPTKKNERCSKKSLKNNMCCTTHIKYNYVLLIQKLWYKYKYNLYKLVSNEKSKLINKPIREIKTPIIYYKIVDNKKIWFMEEISVLCKWYELYNSDNNSNNQLYNSDNNSNNQLYKCIYTNELFTSEEQLYLFTKIQKIKNKNEFIIYNNIHQIQKSLYNVLFDKCDIVFKEFNIYKLLLMQMSQNSVLKLCTECLHVLYQNDTYDILYDYQNNVKDIIIENISNNELYELYKTGVFTFSNEYKKESEINIEFFSRNRHTILFEYNTLRIKNYFLDEMLKIHNNYNKMNCIKYHYIWYDAITNIRLSDSEIDEFKLDELVTQNEYILK
jgi:hypothetical protein